jgi:hypothetical protein
MSPLFSVERPFWAEINLGRIPSGDSAWDSKIQKKNPIHEKDFNGVRPVQ